MTTNDLLTNRAERPERDMLMISCRTGKIWCQDEEAHKELCALQLGCCCKIFAMRSSFTHTNRRGDRDVTPLAAQDRNELNELYVKRHLRLRAQDLRKILCGSSRGKREYLNYRLLARVGIPCAVPIAYGEKKLGPFAVGSFVVTRKLQGRPLDQYWQECPDFDRRLALCRSLANTMRQLHEAGWYYLDWKAKHIYIREGKEETVSLLDVERVGRFSGWHSQQSIVVRSLANLANSFPDHVVTATEKLRFIEYYLQCSNLNAEVREYVAKIHKRSRSTRSGTRWHLYWWRKLRRSFKQICKSIAGTIVANNRNK